MSLGLVTGVSEVTVMSRLGGNDGSLGLVDGVNRVIYLLIEFCNLFF